MAKLQEDNKKEKEVKVTKPKAKKEKTTKEKVSKPKTTKTPKPRVKKIDKDTLMNTPKEAKDGVKVMPFDEETLTVFSLKKMNFKDMTGAQKNTLIVIIIFIICFMVVSASSSIKGFFSGVTSGNLRLPFFGNNEEEKENEVENIVAAGNYIKIGSNDAIKMEDLKFNKFTKSGSDTIVYNYVSTKKIEDVKGLNVFIEIYNNSKNLLSRHRFTNESNVLEANAVGINQIKLSSNNYNKAYYIKIRYISDSELQELPDYEPEEDPSNPGGSSSGSGGSGGSGSGGSGGTGGSTEDPGPSGETDLENEPLHCSYSTSDLDLRIEKNLTAYFEKGKVVTYEVRHEITSMTELPAKNFSKHYKKLLKSYKDILGSPGCYGEFVNKSIHATLSYNIVLKEYKDIKLIPGKDYDMEELKDQLTPYRLEIEKNSTREQALLKLESTNEWICG